jgi:hypothetical protein
MDDPHVYGVRAHTLSFASAAKRDIICPYKAVISLIDKHMVSDFARKHGITLIKTDFVRARWVANLLAFQQAVKKTGATKSLTFHSRVKAAQEFASDTSHGIGRFLNGYDVCHVHGKQRSSERKALIDAFRHAEKGVLTNARCLTEGVDVPAVDMVAFIDPKQSRIDIAQATGRAMRKQQGASTKTVGYVVVPVFATDFDQHSLNEAIESEAFDQVADVLNALQEQDEDLLDIIRELRERKGASEPFDLRRLREKVEVIGPAVDLERLNTSISIAIADRIGMSWDEWYGRLKAYKQREGHCLVPVTYRDPASGYRLGPWVSDQREGKDTMLPERRQRLEALGFVWDAFADQWEEGFRSLEIFHQRKGHCRVPTSHREQGLWLGQWVSTQRADKGIMLPERRERLNALGFVWDPLTDQWEEGFHCLEIFHQRESHCRVPARHREQGYRLGQWSSVQRRTKDTLSPERRARLDALGFVWDPFAAQWEEGFHCLEIFHQREGHGRVPRNHYERGCQLGQWVHNQRKDKETMFSQRRERLNALGFVWDPVAAWWEEGFRYLEIFRQREGQCHVPIRHREQGYRLGQWVSVQRQSKDTMLPERCQRLDALGFVWDPLTDQWEEGFRYLERYREDKGDCLVPQHYCDPAAGYRSGTWVSTQRKDKETLSPERRARLDMLGFVWDPMAAQWEKGFRFLERYRQREGHCRVPITHREQGFWLGRWVSTQRTTRDTMLPERRQRLDVLGFVWDPFAAQWEEGFHCLEIFHQREGHCRMLRNQCEQGYRLGQWVGVQRAVQDKLSPDRRERLNVLGFVWKVR